MKINQTTSNAANQAASTEVAKARKSEQAQYQKGTERASVGKAVEAGSTQISSRAKEMARVKSIATQAPDIREDKIAELKARIAAGEYKTKSEDIASRLVDEHLETAQAGL